MNRPGRLPDFLLIGAPKAGTTAMFRALGQHPRIYCSPVKEPRFFAYAGARPLWPCPGGAQTAAKVVCTEEGYVDLFAACPAGVMAGEASVAYLASTDAPRIAARYVPRARLIAILRHPVERAYSQWLEQRQEGWEPLADFEAACAAEDRRAASGFRPMWLYRQRSHYGRQLDHWLEVYPRQQLLILLYEDWVLEPAAVLDQVFAHLGLEPLPSPRVARANESSRQPRWAWLHHRMVQDNALRRWAQRRLPLPVRDAITRPIRWLNLIPGPALDATLRARLATEFHADVRRVEQLTGRNLATWRT